MSVRVVRKRRERDEQAAGVALLRRLGAAVYVSGTTRRKGDYHGTMQSPGIPDCEAWLPRGLGRVLLKWEVKANGGKLRPEQLAYRALCQQADVHHVVGDIDALIAWLVAHGYLNPDNQFPHYRVPAAPAGETR